MFKGSVKCDGAACTQTTPTTFSALTLSLTRKSATELGLTGASASIYEPLAKAALGDDTFGAALIGLTGLSDVQRAVSDAVPDIAGGLRALAIGMTDQATGVIGSRQRGMMTAQPGSRDDLHFWAQEFYINARSDSTDRKSTRLNSSHVSESRMPSSA